MLVTISTKTQSWDLLDLGNKLGINERSFKLLLEAYRRKNLAVHKQKGIYGIGTTSKYKDKFFKAVDKRKLVSHANNEWTLTPKGLEVLSIIEEYITVPQHNEVIEHLAKTIKKIEIVA